MKRTLFSPLLLMIIAVSWAMYPPANTVAQKKSKKSKPVVLYSTKKAAFIIDSFNRKQAYLDTTVENILDSARQLVVQK